MALKRLVKEMADFTHNPPMLCNAGPVDDNMFQWVASIQGPLGTPYEGGVFFLRLDFPQNYPLAPPTVVFTTRIRNRYVGSDGVMCLDTLHGNWSPALSIRKREYCTKNSS